MMHAAYERPRVQTLSAAQILESVGPVQGYNGVGGGERLAPQTPLGGMAAGSPVNPSIAP